MPKRQRHKTDNKDSLLL